jgi:hypothetical protein
LWVGWLLILPAFSIYERKIKKDIPFRRRPAQSELFRRQAAADTEGESYRLSAG